MSMETRVLLFLCNVIVVLLAGTITQAIWGGRAAFGVMSFGFLLAASVHGALRWRGRKQASLPTK
ncbi:MAG: hypothetical protein E6Q53_01885 [Candidatus Moraniibacteriota bacterium]|nr:MAG: hypothetical protein E6Q53_01885 [Candidatus Moranbacteria bacterium]